MVTDFVGQFMYSIQASGLTPPDAIEADGKLKTGLDGYLKGRGIKTIFVAGLATDFCVGWTAIDARKLGLGAYVIEDACRGIDTQGSLAAAWKNMEKAGVKRIQSGDLAVPA